MNTKHLKAKILDLAIRGKLVPQDSSEGNAADLLQKIRNEKAELIKQKKIKEDKNSSFIIKANDGKYYEQFADGTLKDIEDEIPFEIPKSWCWCKFSECSINRDGERKPVAEKDRIKLEKKYDYIGATGPVDKIDNYLFDETLLLIGEDGANLLSRSKHNAFIVSGKYWVNNHAHVIDATDKSLLNYYCYYINSIRLDDYVTGSAQPKLTQNALNNLLVALPPLSEQQRIVTAIEKAFEQIDIIEKNKLNLKTYIKQTKAKVLDLAIHGKLVEQNPIDGNAFELLEKIRNEKAELIKQKKIKEDKKSSFIIKADDGKHYEQFADGTLKDIEEEIPFEEPKGWTWCRINEIAVDMADGPFGSNLKSEHYTNNKEARIIQLSNLSDEGWREENTRYTTIKHAKENISRSIVEPGNIVIAKMMPAGRAMICPDKEQMYVLSSDCVKLVPIEGVYKPFLVRALNSPFFRNRVVDNVQGVTRQRTSISKLRNCYFPLPPFEEQKRIVERIEKNLKQLYILEKSIGE